MADDRREDATDATESAETDAASAAEAPAETEAAPADTPAETAASERASSVTEATGAHWFALPWVHAVAGGLAGSAIGLVDGWLAVHREGLEPMSGAETTSTLLLALGLNGVVGLILGSLAGAAAWGLTRKYSPATLWRFARDKRTLGAGAVLGLVGLVAFYFWGESKHVEWDAVDWRAPGLGLAFLAAYPGLAWLQRWRSARMSAAGVLLVVLGVGVLGWSRPGDEAADEGLLRIGTESSLSMKILLFARERLFDGDGDRYPTALCRVDCDCDDSDAAIFPGAVEIVDNGSDEDCDGADLTGEEVAAFDAMLGAGDGGDPAPTPAEAAAEGPDIAPVAETEPPPPDPPKKGIQIPRDGPPNVLFVTIDTLRADHLGYEGYSRPTSPNIDLLAEAGVVFRQARATGPQTRFSVPSMLTSKYFTELQRTPGQWPRISEDETLVAELFQAAGYHTAAWHSVSYFTELYGMNQGFDHYDATTINARHPWQKNATSDRVTDQVIKYLDSSEFGATAEPWFFWVYYGDPHSGYLFHEGFPKWGPSRKDAYDTEIVFTDHHLGRLLDELKTRGMLENTVIVLTSDHGEGLDEAEDHGHRFHGPVLHDEAMRIPLIVTAPGLEPLQVETPVSLIDLAPTLVEVGGLEVQADHRGRSLVPYLEGENPDHPPSFFEKEKESALPQKGMVKWPYKVIKVMPYNRIKIYDLEKDPKELDNIYKTMDDGTREELEGLLNYWSSSVLKSIEPKERP